MIKKLFKPGPWADAAGRELLLTLSVFVLLAGVYYFSREEPSPPLPTEDFSPFPSPTPKGIASSHKLCTYVLSEDEYYRLVTGCRSLGNVAYPTRGSVSCFPSRAGQKRQDVGMWEYDTNDVPLEFRSETVVMHE